MLNFENVTNVAYLGPQASFTEIAADYFCQKFKINAYERPCETIKEVVEFVENNPDTLGVLPMENSVEGTNRETLDALLNAKNPNIKILSEHYMPISYCLLSRTTEFYSITGLIATPKHMIKCKSFIKDEMPFNLNIIEAGGMPEAARSLQGYNLTYASIGNKKVAEVFNLNVLKENINDDKTSQTRFILFGDFETEETGNDKTSITFSTENKPGALYNILNILMKNNINISYIASHTPNKQFGEYMITVTFDGHVSNSEIFNALREIKNNTKYMKFLGSYKRSKPQLLVGIK